MRCSAFKRDNAEKHAVVFGQCGGRHYIDGWVADNHVMDGADGTALQGIDQALDFLLGSQFETICQHLVAHTAAFGQQQHLFSTQELRRNGIEPSKAMSSGNDDEERFII